MKEWAPIMDRIDERNYYEEMRNSIIKRSRVHYMADSGEENASPEEEQNPDTGTEAAFSEEKLSAGGGSMEESELDLSDVDPEVLKAADEIYQRLQKEAEEDAIAKRDEWVEKLTQDQADEAAYNKTTGSYSGYYGEGEISQETKDMAANILEEKKLDFDALLEQEGRKD